MRLSLDYGLQEEIVDGYNHRYGTDHKKFFDLIKELYYTNPSTNYAAKILGFNRRTILRFIKDMGYTSEQMRKEFAHPLNNLGPKARMVIAFCVRNTDLYNSQVARMLNISVDYVCHIRCEYNLKRKYIKDTI